MDTSELNADGGVPWNGQGPPPPSISITFPDNSPVSGGSCNTPSCCGNQDKFWLNVPLGLSKAYQ